MSNGCPADSFSSRSLRTAAFSCSTTASSTRAIAGAGGGFAAFEASSASFSARICSTVFPSFFAAASSAASRRFCASSASERTVNAGCVPPPASADIPGAAFPGARGGTTGGAAAEAEPAAASPPSLPGARDGAGTAGVEAESTADSALSIKSNAGTMSAAWLTRSTFGMTTRGSVSCASGTVGSGTVMMSWRGCHSAASTARGATVGSACGMMDSGDSGISGTIDPVTSPDRRSTRSAGRSSSGGGAGCGTSCIMTESGSPSYLVICIVGISFVSFLSECTFSASGVKE